MPRLRMGHRSRHSAGLTAQPVAYLTASVRVTVNLGRRHGGGRAACEQILARPRSRDTYGFAREGMAEQAWRVVGPLPNRTDEPVSCPRRSRRPAKANRLAAVGRWYQPLEAA